MASDDSTRHREFDPLPRSNGYGFAGILAVAVLLIFGGGCSRSSSTPPKTVSAPKAPTPVADDGGAATVARKPVAPKAPKRAKADRLASPPSAVDETTNPNDVFETDNEGAPGYEIVRREEGTPVSVDMFAVILPPKGVDTTQFAPSETEAEPEPAKRSVATPAADARRETPPTRREKGPRRKTPRTPTASRHAETADRTATNEDAEKALPAGFTAIASFGKSPLGWPMRIRCNRDRSQMAFVAGGAVPVGHDGEPAESSPQITVVIDSFYMDVAEVTVGQYERFRTAIKEEKGRNIVPVPLNPSAPPDFPVLGTTLLQSQFYARWVGKELPTEAEWERAARGEGAFRHPWGNGRAIWKAPRSRDEVTAVKSFITDVSPYGIYDLAGNAREWCIDRYSPRAFAEASKASAAQLRNWRGPRQAEPENAHVVKGNGPNWEAWRRIGRDATQRQPDVGFRCVLRLAEKEGSTAR